MKSEEVISVSEKIVGFGEAGSRSATSRAYYGVFHLAIDIIVEVAGLQRERFPPKHSLPQYCLQNVDAKAAEALIGSLQTRRIKADYRLNESAPDSRDFGMYSVEMAKECRGLLMSFLEVCRNDQKIRDEFADGIQHVFRVNKIPF